MKQADLKEKSSVFFIGKGIIVIVLTGIASLSFLLGFFVGKINRPAEINRPSPITDRGSAGYSNPVSTEQKTLPQQAAPLQQAGKMQAPYDTGQRDAAKAIQTVSETQAAPQPQQSNELQKSRVNSQGKNQGSNGSNAASETKKADETHMSNRTKKYTVQVGAFRNASDADALRAKLGKKGYKTFLIELKAKNIEPLYKVTVGSFSTRNEAELLAAKMKTSEGLKTFVTLR
jgi:DedD protein